MFFAKKLNDIFKKLVSTKAPLDDNVLKDLDNLLIRSDVSKDASKKIVNKIKSKNPDHSQIKSCLEEILLEILNLGNKQLKINKEKLNVITLTGINGSGKTGSIIKLISVFRKNCKISVSACDTFRAAALEQIQKSIRKHYPNTELEIYMKSSQYKDPSSLAYYSISESLKKNIDILLIDTAGRLHNNNNLMDELRKMGKTIKKFEQYIEIHNLVVLDSTIGQNLIKQVEEFKKFLDIHGIIITKLDSSSKAGAIFTIKEKFSLPIYFTTFGESINDIEIFDAKHFVKNLLNTNNPTSITTPRTLL